MSRNCRNEAVPAEASFFFIDQGADDSASFMVAVFDPISSAPEPDPDPETIPLVSESGVSVSAPTLATRGVCADCINEVPPRTEARSGPKQMRDEYIMEMHQRICLLRIPPMLEDDSWLVGFCEDRSHPRGPPRDVVIPGHFHSRCFECVKSIREF